MLFLLLCLSVGDQDALSGPCRMGSGYLPSVGDGHGNDAGGLAVESIAAFVYNRIVKI